MTIDSTLPLLALDSSAFLMTAVRNRWRQKTYHLLRSTFFHLQNRRPMIDDGLSSPALTLSARASHPTVVFDSSCQKRAVKNAPPRALSTVLMDSHLARAGRYFFFSQNRVYWPFINTKIGARINCSVDYDKLRIISLNYLQLILTAIVEYVFTNFA